MVKVPSETSSGTGLPRSVATFGPVSDSFFGSANTVPGSFLFLLARNFAPVFGWTRKASTSTGPFS